MTDDFRGYEANAAHVGVSVFLTESEPVREMRPDDVSIQQGDTTAQFQKLLREDLGRR